MYIHPSCDIDDIFQIDSLYSCFKKSFDSTYDSEGESHNFWECVVCIKGNMLITFDDKVTTIYPGQLVFHKPMQFHKLTADGKHDFTALIFSFGAHGSGMNFFEDKCFVITDNIREHLKLLEKESFNVFNKHLLRAKPYDRYSPYIMKSEIEIILALILRESKKISQLKTTPTATAYKHIVQYMKKNIEENLDLKTIAYDNKFSESNLKKIFKKYSNEGVMAHFNRLKIERACELIAMGKRISDISDTLGYSSPNYFAVAFKKIMGISPSEYKKNNNYTDHSYGGGWHKTKQ